MKVFISWSGERSKAVAQGLQSWLRQVIQAADAWISLDMEKGVRSASEISERLEEAKVGIICLTKENLDARWILFEAGALSKTKDAHVCTLLLGGLKSTDVEQPLAQFQHTRAEKDDIFRLVQTVNKALEKSGEKPLPDTLLHKVFERDWPELEEILQNANNIPVREAVVERPQSAILDEILQLVRFQHSRTTDMEKATSFILDLLNRMLAEAALSGRPRGARLSDLLRTTPMALKSLGQLGVPATQLEESPEQVPGNGPTDEPD